MCGIAGIISTNSELNGNVGDYVINMINALGHRGPDDMSIYSDERIKFGGTRLSIIDNDLSKQPIFGKNESLVLFYNGEIYNYKKLRNELENLGHKFKTNGDGEVIIHLYQEFDENYAIKLDGMYAFCLWDKENQCAILGRDRFGIKPLYYNVSNNYITFSSEIKSLFCDKSINVELDKLGVWEYLSYRFVKLPNTIYKNVYKVEPGECIRVGTHGMERIKYFDVDKNYEETSEKFNEILTGDVVSTFVSDTDSIGIILSGGLDSSSVAAIAKAKVNKKLTAYTIGYDIDCWEDERRYAAEVARFIRMEMETVILPDKKIEEYMIKMVCSMGEPIYSNTAVSTYVVNEAAAKKEKVVVSGDGADEFLMGYEHFRNALKNSVDWRKNYIDSIGIISEKTRSRIYNEFYLLLDKDELYSCLDGIASPLDDPATVMRNFEVKYRLPEYQNIRIDRGSMAHSLELRVPFLRNNITNYLLRKNPNILCKEFKKPLADAIDGLLPRSVMDRPKQKFSAPFIYWLQNGLRNSVKELFFNDVYCCNLDLNPDGIKELYINFQDNPDKYAKEVWGVYILLLWYKEVFLAIRGEK